MVNRREILTITSFENIKFLWTFLLFHGIIEVKQSARLPEEPRLGRLRKNGLFQPLPGFSTVQPVGKERFYDDYKKEHHYYHWS